MEANLAAPELERPPAPQFPYSNWGPGAAVLGVVLALGVGVMLGIPGALIGGTDSDGELSTTGNVLAQLGTALGFLLVPMALVAWRGSSGLGEILRRLGVRSFAVGEALKWTAAAVGAYLLFAMLYSTLITPPEQEDIAAGFGALPVQILLIVILAPLAEELLFRGYLFGGLREKLSRWPAALIAGVLFGGLHALTGLSAVPPLIFFGVVLCLLYEKTGSVVPAIILHLLNNSVALLAQ
jgi:membrane protease YdiL (CAAX protease family)